MEIIKQSHFPEVAKVAENPATLNGSSYLG